VITQGSKSFVTQVAGPPLAPGSELTLSVSSDVRGELAVRGRGDRGETLLGRFRDAELRAHRRYALSFEAIRGRPAFVLRDDDDDARAASRQVRVPAGYSPQRNLLVPIRPGDCPASAGQSVADPAGDAFYLNAEDRSPENGSADLRGAGLRLTRKGVCADFTLGGPVGDGASLTTLLRAKPGDRAEQAIRIVFLIRAGVPRVHVLRGFDTTSSSPARAAGFEPRGSHVRLFLSNSLLPSRFRQVRRIAHWQVESATMEGHGRPMTAATGTAARASPTRSPRRSASATCCHADLPATRPDPQPGSPNPLASRTLSAQASQPTTSGGGAVCVAQEVCDEFARILATCACDTFETRGIVAVDDDLDRDIRLI
jgi:hypothetical protein